ncbi:MAG: YgiQ family radical SAM protein [Acidobacteriota bacterium]|nr:YgiQ family radical SAM protein [Acidobacteriota bacterium]
MIATYGSGFDVVLVSGEPWADHPLSPVGVIARVLEAEGLSVGIIERPEWTSADDFRRLGRPRLFAGLTSGSIDSMLVNTTPLKRRREKDPHAPHVSRLPDRAVIVYANRIREAFPGVPVVLGGIEASLRRFAHYDYWENRVRRSLLLDTRADILVYGPGETAVVEIARRFREGADLDGIPGTCVIRSSPPAEAAVLPSFEDVAEDPEAFRRAQNMLGNDRLLAQGHAGRFVVQYPAPVITSDELDRIYGLPFSRRIPENFPQFDMARFSVVTHRGCTGRCSFCALAFHQGPRIISRSEASILEEIRRLVRMPDFKGYVDDLGGPTANMYGMDCRRPCRDGHCLDCPEADLSHARLIDLMRKAREIPGVKKVFVRSGVRFDLAVRSPEYVRELARHHVSGLLKIAPEHVSPRVLELMNKSGGSPEVLEKFRRIFAASGGDLRQHLKYYFMAAHPGSSDREANELARFIRRLESAGERPVEGVQVFTPTPMTRSTCMYHTGMIPETGEPVHVPRTYEEKKRQLRMLARC